jgi:DNA-binding NarL/FixJ family response regulator
VRFGELWLERTDMSIVLDGMRGHRAPGPDTNASQVASLTPRERAIVARICLGESNRQVAAVLQICEKTVRNQLTVVFDKLGVDDRLSLAIFAYQHGLAAVPPPAGHGAVPTRLSTGL